MNPDMNPKDELLETNISKLICSTEPRLTMPETSKAKVLSALLNDSPAATRSRRFAPARRRALRWAAVMTAAAAAVAMLWVMDAVRPSGQPGGTSSPWWAGSSAAWAGEIQQALQTVKALAFREQIIIVGVYGSTHVSGSWRKHYEAPDRSRVDQYYDQTLVSTGWGVPEGNDLLRYGVSYEYECYTVDRDAGQAYQRDPVERLRFYERFRDRADRVLGTEVMDGRECVGFELSASKYGDNPRERVDRIWVDVETRLPVRVEMHGLPVTDHPDETVTLIQDRFEYYADVPADLFTPVIPDGFANTHPDNVRAAREAEAKGQMEWAEAPAEWKQEAVQALKGVETAVYRENGNRVSVSEFAWRVDAPYEGGPLTRTEWYVIEKADPAKTSLDVTDAGFQLVHTVVDYSRGAYRQEAFGPTDRPRHPMDGLLHPISFLDRADRVLEPRDVEGIRCIGVEISAKKYGTNPDGMVHRMWLDERTKRPVRMEFEWLDPEGRTHCSVRDRFEWNPDLSPDTFTPEIPDGFTSDANPEQAAGR